MSVVVAERDQPHLLICKGAVEEAGGLQHRAHGESTKPERGTAGPDSR
jgi:Mg2+-importing ATPase